MQMKSVMKHDFSKSPQAVIPRSSFNRSHGYKTTFNAGYLIPFFVDEVLPGDTFNLKATIFARFATLLFPIMDNMFLDTFFFFVPNRLVWNHWEQFNGYQANPGDSTSFVLPTVTSASASDFGEGTIYDYFGIATQKSGVEVQSLPFRSYNLIWNEWFRDENLQNSVINNVDDGPDSPADYTLLRRGKRYDYFTSCLPFPQKGTAVELPLGSTAPVIRNALPSTQWEAYFQGTGSQSTGGDLKGVVSGAVTQVADSANLGIQFDPKGTLIADLSSATAATINQLRQAFQIQRMYERDARGGTRYTELVKAHFGVTSPDARLQRPEYLGGGSAPVHINPVAATAEGATPQASLAAFGTAAAHNHGFVKSFTEHGHIVGLVSVRADLTYQQGTNRMWFRSTRFDYYWPAFSHLGEQAVLMRELYTQGTADDENVFGYQEAWADYRYKPSLITGLFRTNATGTLDSWHLSQDLTTPALNDTFIQDNPPTTRVKATVSDPDFLMDSFINLTCARPMPTYSVPGFIDHF
jgi:hypothetical protein